MIVPGEFDQQNRVRVTFEKAVDDGLERRIAARELYHRAIDQLHRRGCELDDVLGRLHRLMKAREMAHAQGLVPRQGRQCKMQPACIGERALRTHQQVREVVRERRAFRTRLHHVDVIALYSSQHLGPARFDFRCLAPYHGMHLRDERLIGAGRARNLVTAAEVKFGAVDEQGVDAEHVVHHVAVANRARSAGVVPGHAAQGSLGAGGHVHRVPQPVGPQVSVQLIEHQARLNDYRTRFLVELDHLVQVLRIVDDQGRAHGLAALRRAAAARQDGQAFVGGNLNGDARIVFGPGHHHAHRLDLVDGRVGGITAAAGRIEQDLALELAPQARGERALTRTRMPRGSG